MNDPVNFIDPFGLDTKDSSWWSNAKDTVKGWGQEIKADLTQTWNDIKQLASNAVTGTKSVAKTVMSNIQTNVTEWVSKAKAGLTATGNQVKGIIQNAIKNNTDYKVINESSFIHIAIPEDDGDFEAKDLIIQSGSKDYPTLSPMAEDAVFNPVTKKGEKAPNGYSIRIFDVINNGILEPGYELINEGKGIYRILAFIGKIVTGKTSFDLNSPECPEKIKNWFTEEYDQGKVLQAVEIYENQ